MERQPGGYYIHESFTMLHAAHGSGWYAFTERVGMGGIFYLSSSGAFPYNVDDLGSDVRIHDIYDVLRAVEMGRVTKLVKQQTAEPERCDVYRPYEGGYTRYRCLGKKGHPHEHYDSNGTWTSEPPELCGAYYSTHSQGYSCTLPKGHEGDHVMGGIGWRA